MITIIGSINLDLIATVARLPGPGETVPGASFRSAPGGKGANQALAAARAGAAVRLVGAVGRDPFATQALLLLREGGVDLEAVAETDEPTGTALILVGADGENMIAVVPGANGAVSPDRVAGLAFAQGEHLLLQHEIPLATVEAALHAARRAGGVSLLNTAPFVAEAAPLLAEADIVIANQTEFDLYAAELGLSGASRDARMDDFVTRTGRTIVVTLGGEGAVAAAPGRLMKISAPEIAPVDTVGAGDTFCGYLTAGLSVGMDFEHAMRGAAVAGALACLKRGAQPSIPFGPEVDAAMRREAAIDWDA